VAADRIGSSACQLCHSITFFGGTMKIAQRLVVVILSAGAALAQTAPAHAGFITGVNALNGLGAYEGTFDYNPVDATHGTLKITLKNTSPAANGGYLTAFLFNNPGQHITGATLSSSNLHFQLLGGSSFNNSVNGAPYGRFDLGASTFKSFEGGGNPSNGIAVGNSADLVVLDCRSPQDAICELAPVLHAFKRGRRTVTRPPPMLHAPEHA